MSLRETDEREKTVFPPAMSVILPTYRRPRFLRECLDSLLDQDFEQAAELLVVFRPDDEATHAVLSEVADHRVRRIPVLEPGFLAALRAGLDAASGLYVAFTDDDAVYPTHWLRRLAEMLGEPGVIGAGGVIREEGLGTLKRSTSRLAAVTWSGRVHHALYDRRPAAVVEVDFLAGANMAFRRDRLDTSYLPSALEVAGGAPGNEVLLAAMARRLGGRILCDTTLSVEHRRAPRPDGDRGQETQAVRERARSRALIMRNVLPAHRLLLYGLRMVFLGDRLLPGAAAALVRALDADRRSFADFAQSMAGLRDGLRAPRIH